MDFLDFIKEAEGTAGQPNPYDVVLGYGRYGTPPKPLTQMTLDEVYDFGRTMLAHPDNNFNSSANAGSNRNMAMGAFSNIRAIAAPGAASAVTA